MLGSTQTANAKLRTDPSPKKMLYFYKSGAGQTGHFDCKEQDVRRDEI